MLRDLQTRWCGTLVRAVREDGDRLIRDLRVPFGAATKSMTTAARCSPRPCTPSRCWRWGPEAAAAWRQLAHNAAQLDTVLAARLDMARWGYAPR